MRIKKLISIIQNTWFTRIYLAILLLWMLIVFFSQRESLLKIIGDSKLKMIFLAFIPYFVVTGIINPYLHRITYREQGNILSFWQAFRIYYLSHIGNYLPGKVWFATNYFLFSKKINIDTVSIAKNFVVLNVLLFLVGSICSLPIIFLLNPAAQKLLIVFPFLMFVLIHPKIFNKIFRPFLGNKTSKDFGYIFFLKTGILYFCGYIFLGCSLYLCVLAFDAVNFSNFPIIIAAVASSLIIGLLAIFAPAGIGVKEGVNAAILSQIVPFETAVMAAIVLRIVTVLVDFSCASISALSVAREDKKINHLGKVGIYNDRC